MRRKTTIFVYSLLLALLTATSSLFATPPSNQAKYLSFSNVQADQVTLSWINGNGAGRIVVAATSLSDITSNAPVNATDYAENASYGSAATIGGTAKVVYDGTSGRTATINGLTPGATYYFKVYEFTAGHAEYQTADGITNPRSVTTPANTLTAPAGLAVATWSEGGDLTWTQDANATGYYLTITDASGVVVAGYNNVDVGNPYNATKSKDEFYILGLTKNVSYNVNLISYNNSKTSPISQLAFTTSLLPGIASISNYLPASGYAKIGDNVTCRVNATNGQVGLVAGAITINGVDCASTLVDNGDGTYALTYTVGEYSSSTPSVNASIADGSDLPLSVVLIDGKTVSSAAFANPTNNAAVCGIDPVRPVVVDNYPWNGVSNTPADGQQNGTWPIDHKVYLALNFGEVVTITGAPEFYWGGCGIPAIYDATADTAYHLIGSSNPNIKIFTYTVTENHTHTSLETSTSVITGGIITDANGNAYNSASAIGRVTATFATNNSINTDGTRPYVVSAVKNPPAGQYTNGSSAVYLVTFSEPVISSSLNFADADLLLFSGNVSGYTDNSFVSVHSTNPDDQYTFTNGNLGSANAIIGFSSNSTGNSATGLDVIDANGNHSPVVFSYSTGPLYTFDHRNPTAAITAPTADSYHKALSAITGTAADNADTAVNSGIASVQVAAYIDNNHNGSFDIATDFYFNGTNWTTATTETFLTPTGTDTWTIDPKIVTDGDYYVYVKSTDNAGNTYTSTQMKFTIDNVAPTVSSATITTNGNHNTAYYAKTNETITLVVAASEPIVTPTVTIGGATATTLTSSPASSYTFTLPVDATHPAADGSVSISVSGIADRAGNTCSDYSTLTNTAIVDRVLPTINSGSEVGLSTGAQANQYYVDITVSEPIYTDAAGTTVVAPTDFSANFIKGPLGAASTVTIDAIKGTTGDKTDPLLAPATAAGDLTMRIFFHTDVPTNGMGTVEFTPASSSAIYDIAGNAMAVTSTSGVKTLLDKVAPTIQLVKVNGVSNGNVWVNSTATATITFQVVEVKAALTTNPVVKVTSSTDVLLGTATKSGSVSTTGTGTAGDPYVYTYTITGLTGDYSACKVTVDATDNAGNVASQVILNPALTIDNTNPTVTITEPIAGTYFTGDSHVQYTVVDANQSLTTQAEIGGATSADFSTNGLMKDLAGWTSVTDGSTKTITVSHTDKAGNTGTATYTVTKDNTYPVQSAPAVASVGAPVVANYFNKFNTDVHISTTLANDATLVGGSYKIQYSTDGTNYSDATDITAHTIGALEPGTTLVSSLTASQFKNDIRTTDGVVYFRAVTTDAAGNTTNGDASAAFYRDITAPGITALTVTSDNTINNKYAKDGAVITAYIDANEDVAVTAATAETNDVLSGKTNAGDADASTWNMPWTVAGLLNKAYAFSFTLTDVAGNTATYTEANITSGGDVTIDNTLPTQSAPTTTALLNNVVAGYYNLTNNGFKISVPLDNDASLWNGTNGGTYSILYDVDNAGTWSNTLTALGTSGVISITTGQINNTVDQTLTHAQLVALLPNITSNHTITFKVVTTDLAGNVKTSSATGLTTIDLIAPTATLVSATSDNVINIAEKAAGFTAVAKSNEATGTLYLVDVTTNSSPTYATIGGATVGFASNTVLAANTDRDIAVSSGVASTYILTGKTYKAYTMDAAGNLSPASVGYFTTDLVAPTITSVSTTTANGTYIIGNTVNFTLNLDEAAIFTANGGNASLGLNLVAGTTTALLSANNASSLTLPLTYTVAVNDTASDLTHGALTLNSGAVWADAAGNPVNLTMPAAGTFQGAHAIVIDGIRPTFNVQYYSDEGRLTSLIPTGDHITLNSNSMKSTWLQITTSELLQSAPQIRISTQGTTNNVGLSTTVLALPTSNPYKWKYNRTISLDVADDGSQLEDISIYAHDANGNASLTTGTPAGGADPLNELTSKQGAAFVDAKPATFTVDYYRNFDGTNFTNLVAATGNPYLKAGTYYLKITSSEVLSENPYIAINAEGTGNDVANTTVANHVSGNMIYEYTRTIVDNTTEPLAIGSVLEAITIYARDYNSNETNWAPVTTTSAYTDTKAPTLAGTIFTAPTTANGWWRDLTTQPIRWTAANITDEGGFNSNPVSLDWEYATSGVYGIHMGDVEIATGSTATYAVGSTSMYNTPSAKIKMSVTDKAGNIAYAYSEPFHLDNTTPSIAGITTPATGAFVKGGASTIVWNGVADATYQLTATPVKLELTTDGGSNYTVLSTGEANVSPYTYAWTVPSSPTVDSATAQIRLTATDMAGNYTVLSTGNFTIDNKAPVINVTSTVSDNAHDNTKANAGDKVTITFTSNETLSGISAIALTSGPSATPVTNSTAPSATYHSGTNTWTIDYTVVNTDADGVLAYTFTSSDLAGNTTVKTGTTTLTVLAFDNTKPSATVALSVDNQADLLNTFSMNNLSNTLTVTATFNEPMDQSTTPVFAFTGFPTMTALTGAGNLGWSSSTVYYQKYSIDAKTIETATASLTVNNATDLASNVMNQGSLANVKIDQVLPQLTSIAPSFTAISGTYYGSQGKKLINRSMIGQEVYFDITFNSDMSSSVAPTFATANLVAAGLGAPTTNTSTWTSSTVYRKYFKVIDEASENIGVNITVQAVKDMAGNVISSSINNPATGVFTIDLTAPTISGLTIDGGTTGDNYIKNGETARIVVPTATETLDLAYASNVKLIAGRTATLASGSVFTASYLIPSNEATITEGALPYSIQIADRAGNLSNLLTSSASTLIYDRTAPICSTATVTANNAPLPNSYTINGSTTSITVVASFNSVMSGTPTFTFGTELDGKLSNPSGSWDGTNKIYTITYNVANGALTNTYSLVVDAAKDLADNQMTQATFTGFKVDQVAPTLTWRNGYQSSAVNTNTTDKYAKANENVYFEFTANEAIDLALPVSELIGGQAVTGHNSFIDGSTTVYYLNKTLNATNEPIEGNLAYSISFKDLAGNTPSTITGTSGVIYDKTAPTFTVTYPTAGAYTNGKQVLNYSTTETNSDASGTKLAFGATTATYIATGAAIETIPGWGSVTDGTAGVITFTHTDLAGNIGTTTVSVNKDVTIPTCNIALGNVTLGDNASKTTTDNTVTFTLTFNDDLLNFDANDVTINKVGTTCDAFGFGSTVTGPVSNVYTVTLTNVAGDGTLGITVNKANFTDKAGNLMSADVTSGTFNIDNTLPTVTSVVTNCSNSPIDGYLYNKAARITFSEPVYSGFNASGAVAKSNLSITSVKDGSTGASLSTWDIITSTAGGTVLDVATTWDGATVLGNEKLYVDPSGATQVYDKAGNALAVLGHSTVNWDYAKAQLVVLVNPKDTNVCESSSVDMTLQAQGGNSVSYRWQYKLAGGSTFADANGVSGVTFSGYQTATLTIATPSYAIFNGAQFQCIVSNACALEAITTTPKTLTVYQAVGVATVANQSACFGSTNAAFTATAVGKPTLAYDWQYYNGSTWNSVANGTPSGATYNTSTPGVLGVSGTAISAGVYSYKVIVSGPCGTAVTSNTATLTINALPNATLAVAATNANICNNTATTITVGASENGVDYQLRNGTTAVGSAQAGTGSALSFATGNLTTTTTFNVLATNHTSLCSTQLNNTATVTIETTAVAGTLTKVVTASTVCEGVSVSATLTAGSGGNGADETQYSYDNTNWSAYTSGASISTTGKTAVYIRTSRLASYCSNSNYNTVSWLVEATPVAATITKSPATAAVCAGTPVSATFSGATGGNGTDSYYYSTNGTDWTAYTAGSAIPTSSAITTAYTISVKAIRNSTYCSAATSAISTWTVNPLPTATISGGTTTCSGTPVTLSVALTGTQPWSVTINSVPVTGIVTNPYTFIVSPATTTTYTISSVSDNNNCSNSTTSATTITVTQPASASTGHTTATICQGSTYSLSSATASNYSSILWTTTGQGTFNPSATTLNATYVPAGTDFGATITLTLTAYGNTPCGNSTSTTNLTVNAQPTALATANGTATSKAVCAGSTITLSTPLEADRSYSWTGPNSFSSNSNAPTIANVTSANAGTYQVTVLNNLTSCSNSSSVTVTVNPLPTAAISGTTTICYGTQANLSVALTGTAPWSIVYNDGTSHTINGIASSPYSLNVSPTSTTTYTLTSVTDANTCTSSTFVSGSAVVTVNPLPSAAGTISGTATVDAGTANVAYSVSSILNASSYTWAYSGSGATITGTTNSVTITFAVGATSGNLTVKGHNSCGDGTISANYPIVVNSTVAPSFTVHPNNVTLCGTASATASFNATASGAPAPTYKWQVSTDGTNYSDITALTDGGVYSGFGTSTLSLSSVVGLNGRHYHAIATNGVNPAATSNSALLTVNALPSAPVIAGTVSTCSGSTATITPTPVLNVDFHYYASDGTTSLGTGANLVTGTLTANTDFYVEAFTATCVSANKTKVTVTVNELPASPIASGSIICAGSNATITPTPVAGVDFSFFTVSNGGTAITGGSNTSACTVAPSTTTTYYVEARNTTTHCVSLVRTPVTITVDQAPVAPTSISAAASSAPAVPVTSFNTGTQYIFTANGSTNARTYTWTVPATWTINSVDQTTSVITVTAGSGSGNVTAVANNACLASSACSLAVAPMANEPVNSTLTMTARSRTSITLRVVGHAGTGRLIRGILGTSMPGNITDVVDGTTYSTNATLGASVNATDGISYLYSGSDTLITVSGLASNKSYTFVVYEYNGSGSTTNYTSASNGYTFKTTLKEGDEQIDENTTTGFSVSAITPNPASTDVNFTVSASEASQFKVELYNENGQAAYSNIYNLHNGDNQISFSLASAKGVMPAGVYYLRVSANGETIVKQVIVNP